MALLVTGLVEYGVACHRSSYALAGNDRHPPALYAALVGKTSKGGKGTSAAVARCLLERYEPDLAGKRVLSGFGSGEALIDALSDNGDDDDAPRDTRALMVEPELGKMLRIVRREGNTLGGTLRDAWCGIDLETHSRSHGTVKASGYHLGIVAHVTIEELTATMGSAEIYGGTANRILWTAVRRAQLLPNGGNVPDAVFDQYGSILRSNLHAVRRGGQVKRTEEAERRWCDLYHQMAADDPGGMLGAAIARAEPNLLRLALAYALADGKLVVDVVHIEAAWAIWKYARASAALVWGANATGDTIADRLLKALKESGEGLDGRAQAAVLARHATGRQLDAARELLLAKGLVVLERDSSRPGRPREIMRLVD